MFYKFRQYLMQAAIALLALASAIATAGEVITYFHNDISGTPLVATDASGNVVWKENYRPYGDRLNNEVASSNNELWFAGKPYDSSTGLSYMGARYYDPVLGRFMGVDSVGFDEANIHSFNRYAYANNNPYRYVDPDGKDAVEAINNWWSASVAGFQSMSAGDAAMKVLGGFGPAEGAALGAMGAIRTLGAEANLAAKGLGNQNPLYKAAVDQFKSTELSNAGRALTKHPELIGETKETLRQTLRTDGAINDAAHGVLRDIMRNGVTTTPTLGRYGTVTQTQIPGGFGARWTSDGSFIGFINP